MVRREAAQLQLRRATRGRVLNMLIALAVIIGIAFLALTMRPAHSAGFESCQHGSCMWGDLPTATGPKIIQVPQDNSEEAQARGREWLKVCAPTYRRDKFGVTRYVYKKAGCEFGSPEK